MIVLLDGEDRAGCGSEWREDQGDVAGAEGISEKKRGEKWNILHILMETEHNP